MIYEGRIGDPGQAVQDSPTKRNHQCLDLSVLRRLGGSVILGQQVHIYSPCQGPMSEGHCMTY